MPDQTRDFEPHDLQAAFSLLTRLPISVDHARAGKRGAGAAWAFPLVGLLLGGMFGLFGVILGWIGIPNGMVAAFVLLGFAMATGAMHEDGLADFADGIWGGTTVDQRLDIMKDSRIGAYGAVALIVFLLMRFSGISALSGWDLVLTLAAVGAGSRSLMVGAMFMIDPAKPSGLSASAGQPSGQVTGVALMIGLAACVVLTGFSGIILFAVMAIAIVPVCVIALKKLDGQTGDVLGAVQQCAEVAGLAMAIALL